MEPGRGKRGGVSQRAFPSESASRPQLEATATSATFSPAFNEGRGRGEGEGAAAKAGARRQLCREMCAGPREKNSEKRVNMMR